MGARAKGAKCKGKTRAAQGGKERGGTGLAEVLSGKAGNGEVWLGRELINDDFVKQLGDHPRGSPLGVDHLYHLLHSHLLLMNFPFDLLHSVGKFLTTSRRDLTRMMGSEGHYRTIALIQVNELLL